MTSYVTATPIVFPLPPDAVYDALIDLPSYPKWNHGMQYISAEGPMAEGLRYTTRTKVPGHLNEAHVLVEHLVPGREIELVSDSGVVPFRAFFRLIDQGADGTEVICTLRFELNGLVLGLARPAIEAMARQRMREDLTTLRQLITAS